MTTTPSSAVHPIAEAAERAIREADEAEAAKRRSEEETRRASRLEDIAETAREAAGIALSIFGVGAGAAGDPGWWAPNAPDWLPAGAGELTTVLYAEVPHPAGEPIRYLFRHQRGQDTLDIAARAQAPGTLHFVPFRDLAQLGRHMQAGDILTGPPVAPPSPTRTVAEILLRGQDVYEIDGQPVEVEIVDERRIAVTFPKSGVQQTFEVRLTD